jgi:hypothetical protein
MKLAKLTTLYPSYLAAFYGSRPGLEGRPWAEQMRQLAEDCFAWADYWSDALEPLGWDVLEISANALPAQRAWAREQGLALAGDEVLGIARAQVLAFKPDVLWVDDYNTFDPDFVAELRAACPSIRLALSWCGAPYRDHGQFKGMDLVLSCVPELVADFTQAGIPCALLPHAFSPKVLQRLALRPAAPPEALSFVGQVQRDKGFHRQRERLLEHLLDQGLPLSLHAPMAKPGLGLRLKHGARWGAWALAQGLLKLGIGAQRLRALPVLGKAAAWSSAPTYPVNGRLARVVQPPAFGLAMYGVLQASQVTLNSHIELSARSASNLRLFEATGVGTCLLTDAKADLARYFEPGKEVETYASVEEAAVKARALLADPARCRQMGQAAQARVLKDHTFAQRAPEWMRLVETALKRL